MSHLTNEIGLMSLSIVKIATRKKISLRAVERIINIWRTMVNAWKKVRQNCSILVDFSDWKWIFRIAKEIDSTLFQIIIIDFIFICMHATSTTRHKAIQQLTENSSSKAKFTCTFCTINVIYYNRTVGQLFPSSSSTQLLLHHHLARIACTGGDHVYGVCVWCGNAWICFENRFQFNKLLKSIAGIKSRSEESKKWTSLLLCASRETT